MRIREIRNSEYFQDFCQKLFAAEWDDFQSIDDSGGDKGNDGYIPSQGRLFAIYCPEKPASADYKTKIKGDLAKAVSLRDTYKYKIQEWIFVTPEPLSEDLTRFLTTEAAAVGLTGIAWSEN